jgi:hypothetical protein
MDEDRFPGHSEYNVLWGGFVVLFPLALFRVLEMEPPNYPQIWQCVGLIVGVHGDGYAATARAPSALARGAGGAARQDPRTHRVPLRRGRGTLPLSFPFALILLRAYQPTERCERRTCEPPRYAGRQCTSPLLETPQTSWKEPLGA